MTNSITDLNIIDYGNITVDASSLFNSQTTNVYSINGFNGTSVADFSYGDVQISYPNDPYMGNGKLLLTGENADIDINGSSLKDFMTRVEERLAMLSPDPRLESEWEELLESRIVGL